MPPKGSAKATKDDADVSTVKESKRVANRLAQRKFRRQRKDYVDYLERELALCRAGANEELVERRKEVERIKAQRDELKDLLDHVVNTLSRVCGESSAIGVTASTKSTLRSNQHTHHQNEDGPQTFEGCSPGSDRGNEKIRSGLDDTTISTTTYAEQSNDISGETFDQRERRRYSTRQASKAKVNITTVDENPQEFTASLQDDLDSRFPPTLAGLDAFLTDHFSNEQSIPAINEFINPTSVPLEVIESNQDAASLNNIRNIRNAPTMNMDGVPWMIPLSSNDTARGLPTEGSRALDGSSYPQHIPPMGYTMCQGIDLKGAARPTRAQLLSVMYRRNVTDVLDSLLTAEKIQSMTLEAIGSELTSGIVQIISTLQQSAIRVLKISSMAMFGGIAWIHWQLAKSQYILPRLAQLGLLEQVCEGPDTPDIFLDTIPTWLRPTTMQKTIHYNCAINFLPWPEVRNALILNRDVINFDDFVVHLTQRLNPTGADEDRTILTDEECPNIWYQFHSQSEREFRDLFYGSLGSWKLKRVSNSQNNPATGQVNELVGKHISEGGH